MRGAWWLVASGWWLVAGLMMQVGGAEPERVEWLAGAALETQFAQPVTVNWSYAPLKSAITNLARLHRVALVLDRRVDPEQTLQFSVSGVPLERACEQLAGYCRLGFCRLGPIGYFGPPAVAARLRTLAALRRDDAQRLPNETRAVLARTARWQWDDFATPRELLDQLAQRAEIKVTGVEQIPHDLWAAGDLPSMSLLDRLTLLAVQFDLTFRFEDDGRTIALIPVPDRVVIERSYPASSRPQEQAQRWAALVPSSQVEVVGRKIVVRGPVEDHERLTQPRRKPTTKPGQAVYTLTLKGLPLERVLEELPKRLQFKLRIDREALARANISLDQPVTLQVENATLEGLLQAALEPAGLLFHREGDEIVVEPAARR
jgi:hypothetical protein